MLCVGPTLSEKELQKFQDQYSFHPDVEEQAEFYSLIKLYSKELFDFRLVLLSLFKT